MFALPRNGDVKADAAPSKSNIESIPRVMVTMLPFKVYNFLKVRGGERGAHEGGI